MKETYFLKLLNRLTLLFGLFNYLVFSGENFLLNIFIFSWFLSFVFLSYVLKSKNKKYYFFLIIIMIIPVFFINAINDILLFLIIFTFSLYFIIKDKYKLYYGFSKCELMQGLFIISIIFLASVIFRDTKRLEAVLIPYFLIYLISAIILARNTRNSILTKKNRITNLILTLIVLIIVFILSIKNVRILFLIIISNMLLFLGHIILKLILIILKVLNIKMILPNKGTCMISLRDILEQKQMYNFYCIANNTIISHLILIILVIFVLYLIIWILRNLLNNQKFSNHWKEGYYETHEFIFKKNVSKHKNSLLKKIENKFSHKTNREKIRFYYKNYLKKCIEKDIIINKSDTSYDINLKTRNVFKTPLIEHLRKIYIKIRYSDCTVDNETVTEFIEHYKKLKKTK